jgi:iron-sulfur cluster assembly protein
VLVLVNITDKAVEAINGIRAKKSIPAEYSLRIGIKGAGCAGVSYLLGFDKPKQNDDRISIKGLDVLVEKKHALYLAGLTVDYQSIEGEEGFTFDSPTD